MTPTTRRSFLAGMPAMAAMAAAPALPEIVPGVWLYQGDYPSTGQGNSILIEMKDHLVLVDSNSVSGARAVAEAAKRISPKPVEIVLLTHHHGDHIYGNALWTRAGATTIAHQSMRGELARIEPARWRRGAANDPAMAELGDAPEPPTQTFNGESWILQDSRRDIEVHYFGAAHTRDDVFVYLPGEQVLCSGDAAIHTSLNSFMDCDFGNWPAVLRKAAQLKVKHVLPGHGAPAGKELLELQEQFLALLRKAAEQSLASGQKPAEAAAALEIPEKLRPWAGPSLTRQLGQVAGLLQKK